VLILPVALAFAISFALSPVFRKLAGKFGHMDTPNERSSHGRSTPRSGGLAILIGIIGTAVATSIVRDRALLAMLVGAVALSGVALVDERRALPRLARFVAQIAVATVVASAGDLMLDLGPFGPAITVIWIVGVINVYNFMDGANGLASMQGIIAGIALAILLASSDAAGVQLALAVVGAAAGFLPWNLPRASIFMGDTGSNALGLLFGSLILRAVSHGVPFPAAALILAPFLFDASVTIAVRIVRREAFFSTPHRLHFYQRLLDRGWTHVQVTTAWSVLAALSAAAAVLYPAADAIQRSVAIAVIVVIHTTVAVAIIATRPRGLVRRT
jgi:UDP-N-acetylmuramyl pentapeptide phosphotransferase/UDP-N-acetylglucosamine-1-phosphate transferase